jgi:hypothetical protein
VQFVAYYRTAAGGFAYWTSSPYLPASGNWTQATWTTPALPAGATGISFGLSIFSNGTLTVDDFSYADTATLPPVVPPTAMGNASLETASAGGLPDCWTPSSFGANDATFSRTGPGHSGDAAQTVTITSYTDGAAHLLPTMYGSTCAPEVTPGKSYTLSAWYMATGVSQFSAYYLTLDGTWHPWTWSPWLAAADAWTEASFVTPAVPEAAVRVAFGLSLISAGRLTTDDYGFAQTA